MGLSTALGAALSGLKVSQQGLELVSNNVANSQTVGYTKKTLSPEAQILGGRAVGVRADDVRRELDVYLQRQLRTETAGASFAGTRADYLDRLQTIFGTPGGSLSLDTNVSRFSASLSALATSPDNASTRAAVLAEAQTLAQSLNAATRDVQTLRAEADRQIGDGVASANEALQSIEQITKQIVRAQGRGESAADLLDQRDMAIDALSSLMDVKVEDAGRGEIRVTTQGGATLYDGQAATLSFTPIGVASAETTYAGGQMSGVTLTRPSGQTVDLFQSGQIRSGELKALVDLRDKSLTEAQTQLDEIAANLAQALGANTTEGTAVTGGVSLTTEGALAGDRLSVSYTSGGVSRSVTIVNVGDPSRLPLENGLTPDPNDVVIGVDFNSPTAAADLDAALAAQGVAIDVAESADGFAFTAGAGVAVTGGQSRITATELSGDGVALPLFVDGGAPYSASLDGGDQRLGFAGRITVNPELLADPAKLTVYADGVGNSDPARPQFLRDALTADRSFSLDTGLGGASQPFKGSVLEFAQGAIAAQARASATANRVSEGQTLVVSQLSDRYSESSGVDIDEEMGRLIQLQTAYGANARVVTTVKEMMDMLMNI